VTDPSDGRTTTQLEEAYQQISERHGLGVISQRNVGRLIDGGVTPEELHERCHEFIDMRDRSASYADAIRAWERYWEEMLRRG
jgi:hypothetical protein